ncbi:MAG: FtsX-like permease family protein [Gemmatimonadales bacterium]
MPLGIRGLRRTFAPALHGLRAYWGTMALVAAAGGAATAALLPATSLVGGPGLIPRVSLPPDAPTDFGILWSVEMQDPTALHHIGVVTIFQLLLGVAAGVLAVAWLTTLAISAARAAARSPEISIRRSVGATRRHLLLAHLAEGAFVAAAALLFGGTIGWLAGGAAAATWPGLLGAAASALTLTAASAIAAAIILGALFPLAYARRSVPLHRASPGPLGLTVPAFQLGLSLTVLVAAGLLWREAARLTHPAAGPVADSVLFQITAAKDSAPLDRAAAYARLLRQLGATPGVAAVSLANRGEVIGAGVADRAIARCGSGCMWGARQPVRAMHYLVSADSFRAVGLKLLAGRAFTDRDDGDAPKVAVVNQSFALLHFHDGDPIGHQIEIGRGLHNIYTVVGEVEDRPPAGIGGGLAPRNVIYLSVLQHPAPAVELLVRAVDPSRLTQLPLAADVRTLLGPTAGEIVRTTPASVEAAEAAPLAWFARLFALEGWVMLAIATIGTFVTMRQWVDSLLAELGLRRAVGARRWQVIGYVLAHAAAVAVVGLTFGLLFGLGVWGTLQNVIAGTPAWDGQLVRGAAALLALATLAGALWPAWRAAYAAPARLVGTA